MDEILVREIMLDNEFLNTQNENFRAYCEDIADYCLPRKAWINTIRTKGERIKFNFLYDSTAIRAVRFTAAGFHSNLTNPTSRWFGLESRNKKLMKRSDVRRYFKEVEDEIYASLQSSNFYNTIQEFFTDYITFSSATFSHLEDDVDGTVFNEIPVGQVNRVVDSYGRLIGIYRNFRLTAHQAFKLFGAKAGPTVIQKLESKPFEEIEFLHYAGQRYRRDLTKKDNINMPIMSVWINKKDKHLISESGFLEMPYHSDVFYKDPEDPNGFSPAMDVFPEIKLVNAMQRTLIRADMKQADPPYVLPSRGFVLPLNLNPAGMNYRDAKTSKDDIATLPVGRGNLSITIEHIKMVQQAIETGMFVPLFRALQDVTKQMTIPEVQRRVAENMALLGPVVGRCTKNALAPAIVRQFHMLNRKLALPQPPEVLSNTDFDPVFLSPLAIAQRQSEVAQIQAWLGDVQAIASVIPSARYKVDEDKTIDVLHRIRGITPEILRSDEDVERLKRHEEEQQQMIQAMQMGGAGADMAKTAAEAQAVGAGR